METSEESQGDLNRQNTSSSNLRREEVSALWHLALRQRGAGGCFDAQPNKESEQVNEAGDLLIHTDGDTLIVSGDIDLYQAPTFRRYAEAHIQETEQPRLDLNNVPFLDSAGLAVLLSLSRQATAQNKTLRVLVSGGPRRVLKITGIDRVLMMED